MKQNGRRAGKPQRGKRIEKGHGKQQGRESEKISSHFVRDKKMRHFLKIRDIPMNRLISGFS